MCNKCSIDGWTSKSWFSFLSKPVLKIPKFMIKTKSLQEILFLALHWLDLSFVVCIFESGEKDTSSVYASGFEFQLMKFQMIVPSTGAIQRRGDPSLLQFLCPAGHLPGTCHQPTYHPPIGLRCLCLLPKPWIIRGAEASPALCSRQRCCFFLKVEGRELLRNTINMLTAQQSQRVLASAVWL